MSESNKALLQFGIIGCAFFAFFAWFWQPANFIVWSFRIIFPAVIIWFIYLLINYYRAKDLAPDLLAQNFGLYFERDGFCFSLCPSVENGVMIVKVGFQNRYAKPSEAHIELKLFSGLLEKDALGQKAIDVKCPPGGYGVIKWACGVPLKYQGKKARIETGATINYSEGRGEMVRFRDGTHVGGPKLTSSLTPLKVLLGLFIGYISHPAYSRFTLPINVREVLPNELEKTDLSVLWQLSIDPKTNSRS